MNSLFAELNLPDVFNKDYNIHSFPIARRTLLSPSMHLNREILQILYKADLRITQVELFYSPPDNFSKIHSDVYTNDISKINWSYHGSDSKMIWYEPLIANTKREGPANNSYIGYEPEQVKELASTTLVKPSLIQAAVPHNVLTAIEERWCVSLMLTDNKTKKQATFGTCIERLAELDLVL